MPFFTKLVVTEAENEQWELVSPLIYSGTQDVFEIPAGFKTDFASVPQLLWNIVPPYGLYTKAAVVHDWLYRTQSLSRADADGIFRRIMRESEVGRIKRYGMWAAVRLFGSFAWKKNKVQ